MESFPENANLSTAFHPESDGQTERVNESVELHLRIFCGYLKNDWADLLPMAGFAYNSTHHSSIAMSPFFANHGYHPRMSITVEDSTAPDAEESLRCLRAAHCSAEAFIKHALEAHTFWANKKRIPAPDYEVGDELWLMRRLPKRLPHGTPCYHAHPKNPVIHVSLVGKYIANRHPQRYVTHPPDPTIVDDVQRYFIERIRDSHFPRGRLDYFVHW